MEKLLETMLLEKAKDIEGKKKITCSDLFIIAKELKIKPILTGEACNKLGIKITSCQLGCFE